MPLKLKINLFAMASCKKLSGALFLAEEFPVFDFTLRVYFKLVRETMDLELETVNHFFFTLGGKNLQKCF